MTERTKEILLRVTAETNEAARRLEGVTKRVDALNASVNAAAAPWQVLTGALDRITAPAQDIGRRLASVGRSVLKLADAEAVGRVKAMTDQIRALAEQVERLAGGAGALRPMMGPLSRVGAGGGNLKEQVAKAEADAGPIAPLLGGIRQEAARAGVDLSRLGAGVSGLGAAMDEATDELNKLRNGIDGLGDRLVLFGGQGERLRNEIEEIRDPALRARVANEEWARAQGNLNGVIGKASDQLQVLKIRAAGAVGGMDNLNLLMGAGALAAAGLAAALLKVGETMIRIVAEGYKEWAKSQEDFNRRTNLSKAQAQSLDQSVGHLGDSLLDLKNVQDGTALQMSVLDERLEGVASAVDRLSNPLTKTGARLLEMKAATVLGVPALAAYRHASSDLGDEQRELSSRIREANDVLASQQNAVNNLRAAYKQLADTLNTTINDRAGEVAREFKVGVDAYKDIKQSIPKPRSGGGRRQAAAQEELSSLGLGGLFEAPLSQARDLMVDVAAAGERAQGSFSMMGQILRDVVQPAAQDAFGSMATFYESAKAQTESLMRLTDQLGQSFVAFGVGALQGLTAFAMGAQTGGQALGGLLQTLGQISTSTGSYLLLAGAGFSALPLGFTASGAVGAGIGLVALGASLGVAGAAISSGRGAGAAGGASGAGGASFARPDLGARPESQPRRTEIVLQVGREVLGRVIEDEVNARISLNRILNVPATAR